MSTVNYLSTRSSNLATFNTIRLNVSTLTGSTLQTTATVITSSIVVSTLQTQLGTYSTLTGSTITSNNLALSTLTVSSINSGAPGVAAYSTLNVSSLTVVSTTTVSTLGYSTLTGSTITATTMGYSTLTGSTITSNNLALSTLTVSSINSGAPGVAAYSTLNVSSLNATSTITTSTMTTTSNVGIGTATPTSVLTINNTGAYQTHHLIIRGQEFYAAGNSSTGIALNAGVNRAANKQLWFMDPDLAINTTNGCFRIIPGSTTTLNSVSTDGTINLPLTISGSSINLSGGNVGIGTITPTASLQITNSSASGSGYGSLLVDSPNAGSAGGCITIRNSTGSLNGFCSLLFEVDGSTACTTGTTPLTFTQANGMIYCQSTNANNAGKLGFIQWNGSAEVETMTILPSGNLGINNTAPKSLLSVLGGQIMVETGTAGNDVEYVSPTPGIHIRGNGNGGTAQMIFEARGVMTAGIACNSAGINIQSQSGGSVFLKYGVAYSGDYGGGSTGLQVNGSGVVLKPSQPYVSLGTGGTDASVAYNYQGATFGYSGFAAYLTPYQSVGFTNTTGNGWVAAYGTFTAPWTGRYQVNMTFYWNSFTAGNRWSINIYNSAGTPLQSKYCCIEGGGIAGDTIRPYGTTLYMSAGDYFQITLSSYNGGSCNAYFGGITHSSMTIVFIG